MEKKLVFENLNGRKVVVEFYYTTENFDYQDSRYHPADCYFEAFYNDGIGYEADGSISEHFGKISKALGIADKKERIQWFIKHMAKEGWALMQS